MTNPLVSVVIAAYQEEAFIAQALQSVLDQSYQPIEVIVVDDGSTDRTAEIAAAHHVTVLRRPHNGPAAARNTGLATATGQYWTIFDADDLMPPDRIKHQIAHLQTHPEHDLVLGLTEAFTTPGQPTPPHYNPNWNNGPFHTCAGTMLARRSVLDVVGLYDENVWLAYDVEWLARAKDAGVAAGQVEELTLRYRIHSGNTSANRPEVHRAMLKLLRESVERSRELARDRPPS